MGEIAHVASAARSKWSLSFINLKGGAAAEVDLFLSQTDLAREAPIADHNSTPTLIVVVDHLVNALRQRLQRKRLGQHMHASLQSPVVQSGVFRISGDEQNLQVGAKDASGINHLSSIEAVGQPHIRNQEIYACV